MKKVQLTEEVIKLLQKEKLYEMSNIHEEESGLKSMLHLYYNGANSGLPHGNRVKVQLTNNELFPIIVNKEKNKIEPLNKNGEFDSLDKTDKKLVKNAEKFIKENIDIIDAYWEGKFKEPDLHMILAGMMTIEQAINKYKKK